MIFSFTRTYVPRYRYFCQHRVYHYFITVTFLLLSFTNMFTFLPAGNKIALSFRLHANKSARIVKPTVIQFSLHTFAVKFYFLSVKIRTKWQMLYTRSYIHSYGRLQHSSINIYWGKYCFLRQPFREGQCARSTSDGCVYTNTHTHTRKYTHIHVYRYKHTLSYFENKRKINTHWNPSSTMRQTKESSELF